MSDDNEVSYSPDDEEPEIIISQDDAWALFDLLESVLGAEVVSFSAYEEGRELLNKIDGGDRSTD